jgi:uncharacterized protein YbjT (DUF2867 family)
VLVTGASGNVGREVVRVLCARGVPVRAAGRANGKADADGPGVERVAFDFRDPTTFAAAAEGCSAVFLVRPPPISDVRPTLNAFIDVARAHGVRQVVFLSVTGAGSNRFVPHHDVEVHLAAGPSGWTVLRPGFFAQNLADAYRRDIVEDHRIYVPAGRGVAAFIDGRDIAEVAALALVDPEAHAGEAYTLTGPEAVSFAQVTASLTRALGHPIRYVPASVAGYAMHLHRRGLPAAQIAVQTILHVGLRFGQAAVVDPTLERLLGRPGYTIDAFVRDHVALWR